MKVCCADRSEQQCALVDPRATGQTTMIKRRVFRAVLEAKLCTFEDLIACSCKETLLARADVRSSCCTKVFCLASSSLMR